ncbi:O-antigen ligase family protein [Sphingomonas changbaiensis]|uniref:O-antigen ligase family protein n=1 Tax=Sphingomonas changbaiensis TaxID=529705 RepID=UPI00146FE4CD|nr:O-antigen ligase family protein [Sphingomonas changbaiensis]
MFWVLVGFLACCFAFGGSSRVDVFQPMLVRSAAVLLIAASIGTGAPKDWSAVRVPALLLAAAAAVVALQLIPLPPALWTSLPGRSSVRTVADVIGSTQPWRPISLTPDLTLNTLLSLLPPAAILVGIASIAREDRMRLLSVILVGGGVSVVIGLVQITSRDLYFFRITNPGYPVGVFANRNHQAALVACMLPMLGVFAGLRQGARAGAKLQAAFAAVAAIALLPFVLANGSRAGLGLAIAGLAAGLILYAGHQGAWSSLTRSRAWRLSAGAAALAGVVLVGAAALYSRNDAITRISSATTAEDQRFQFIPQMTHMTADFFPVGSGFGSFDSVFRSYEPSEALLRTYFNHAHNDALELAIEAGAFGFIVLTVLLGWWATRAAHYWRDMSRDSSARRFGRLGSVVIGILFVASLVDYPLRTPLLGCIFFVAACWMHLEPTGRTQKTD